MGKGIGKNINALNYSFNDFVTALHDSIQSEQEMQTAKWEGDPEELVNHIHPNQQTHYVPGRSGSDLLDKLLDHFARHPKYVNKLRYDRSHNQIALQIHTEEKHKIHVVDVANYGFQDIVVMKTLDITM